MNELEIKFKEKTGYDFNNFYINNKKLIYNILYKNTLNKDIIEDIVEDAFLKSIKHINTYKTLENGGSDLITWITNIALNLLKSNYKKSKKMILCYDDITINEISYENTYTEDEEYALEKENYIKKLIYELGDKHREIMILREIEGLEYKEISEYLNIKLQTIKNRVRRGRQIIQLNFIKKYKEYNTTTFIYKGKYNSEYKKIYYQNNREKALEYAKNYRNKIKKNYE